MNNLNTYNHYINVNNSLSLTTERIAYLRKEKWTVKKIANFANKSERTIYRWFKPNTEPLQKRGVKPKVTETVASLIRSYALENRIRTQQEMADYVYQELGVKISRPTVNVCLKKLGITHKKLTYHYTQLDEEKAKAFNEEIKLLLPCSPFLALDECAFYPKLDPKFGYSLKGSRAIDKKPSHKGKHYTLLFAISNSKENGVVRWKLTDKKVD